MADTDALESLLKIRITKPSMLLPSLDSDPADLKDNWEPL